MKPVYSLQDIEGFKMTEQQREFIHNNNFTKKQLIAHLKNLKKEYYSKCKVMGWI